MLGGCLKRDKLRILLPLQPSLIFKKVFAAIKELGNIRGILKC